MPAPSSGILGHPDQPVDVSHSDQEHAPQSLGHQDAAGRLFIDGRADDMIISGGENVFPGEIEEVLASHPAITEAAVVGISDEQFGSVFERS